MQVDKSENDIVSTHKMGSFTVKTNKQGTKLVYPSKGAFTGKATLTDVSIEEAFGRIAMRPLERNW